MMKAKRKKKSNIGFILIFVLGFLILMYPQISRFYYRMDAKDSVQLFDEASSKLGDEEIARRMELARAYNSSLKGANLHDPYSEEKQAEKNRRRGARSTRECWKFTSRSGILRSLELM